jgi:hypothetical protein
VKLFPEKMQKPSYFGNIKLQRQKIRDGEIVEDYEGDFDLEDILDDETSEDEVNRMTDSMFKEVWGYDYNELINKLN